MNETPDKETASLIPATAFESEPGCEQPKKPESWATSLPRVALLDVTGQLVVLRGCGELVTGKAPWDASTP